MNLQLSEPNECFEGDVEVLLKPSYKHTYQLWFTDGRLMMYASLSLFRLRSGDPDGAAARRATRLRSGFLPVGLLTPDDRRWLQSGHAVGLPARVETIPQLCACVYTHVSRLQDDSLPPLDLPPNYRALLLNAGLTLLRGNASTWKAAALAVFADEAQALTQSLFARLQTGDSEAQAHLLAHLERCRRTRAPQIANVAQAQLTRWRMENVLTQRGRPSSATPTTSRPVRQAYL